jgi:histidyl-tRNA synthetase
MTRGRLREFYQCDFDIAGEYDSMIPDSEILCIIVEVFEALGLEQDITIKMNHRKILDGLFKVAGVPDDKIRPISSAVDKLDKLPWEEVKKEMGEKGLSEEVADKIGEYVKLSGGAELIETLRKDEKLTSNDDVKAGLDDLDLLFKYLGAFNVANKVSFDLSLARGLDYYTGLIYEVVIKLPDMPRAPKDEDSRIGSIAAGGRYDNLVGMFSKRQIPCVGISFGVDRIFTILKLRQEKEKNQQPASKTDVFVMAFGGKGFDGLLPERMAVARMLWKAGIRAEFAPKVKPKLPQQFKAAESNDTPLAVILGEGEVAAGQVRLKVLGLGDQASAEEKDGRLVANEDLVAEVKKYLSEIQSK